MKTTFRYLITETLIALLLLTVITTTHATETKNSSLEALETELQLENWMVTGAIWNTNAFDVTDFNQLADSKLEFENWMSNDNFWNLSVNIDEGNDAGLELENWMFDDEIWNVENSAVEPALMLENWMLESNIWK